MFLITPKAKNNPPHASKPYSQPVAKVSRPARVQAACDRCRMKKVKCDGERPCLRCTQDDVVCTATKKVPTDAKGASIEYIRSMETQQTRLIKALRDISRHVRQPVVRESDMKQIMETVRNCGFGFELEGMALAPNCEEGDTHAKTAAHVPASSSRGSVAYDSAAMERPKTVMNSTSMSSGIGLGIPNRKRKAAADATATQLLGGFASSTDTSGGCNGHGNSDHTENIREDDWTALLPSKRRKKMPVSVSDVPEHTDDYWDLDAYCDELVSLHQQPLNDVNIVSQVPEPAALSGRSNKQYPFTSQEQELPSNTLGQRRSSIPMPDWILDCLFQPAVQSNAEEELSPPDLTDQVSLDHKAEQAAAAAPSLSATDPSDPFDWESTLWWDPSLLFDTTMNPVSDPGTPK